MHRGLIFSVGKRTIPLETSVYAGGSDFLLQETAAEDTGRKELTRLNIKVLFS